MRFETVHGSHPVEYRVAVLLSAHGRSPFLREQLASIRAAITSSDILIVVDDGSGHVDWAALVGELPDNYLCWSRLQGLGSSTSFMELLCDAPVRARYYSWADQDDIWHKEKLSRQLQLLAASPDAWACVHGWRTLRQGPSGIWVAEDAQSPIAQRSVAHYCFETPAPGMTLCMTEDARQKLLSVDAELRNRLLAHLPHDRLLCGVLGAAGRMLLTTDALVDYRQHSSNLIGAPRPGRVVRAFRRLQRRAEMRGAAQAGRALYQQVMADGLREGLSLPQLADQRLRANGWENWLMKVWLRWRR